MTIDLFALHGRVAGAAAAYRESAGAAVRAFDDLHSRPIDVVEQLNWRGKPVQREVRAERPIDVLSKPLRPQHVAGGASADGVARAVRMLGTLEASLSRVAVHEGELNAAVDDAIDGVRSLSLHADSESRAVMRLEQFRPTKLVSQPDRELPPGKLRLVQAVFPKHDRGTYESGAYIVTRPGNSPLEQATSLSERAERSLRGSLDEAPLEPWSGHDLLVKSDYQNGVNHPALDRLGTAGTFPYHGSTLGEGRLDGTDRTKELAALARVRGLREPEPILDMGMRDVRATIGTLDRLLDRSNLASMVDELEGVDRTINDAITSMRATSARVGDEIDVAANTARDAYSEVFRTR